MENELVHKRFYIQFLDGEKEELEQVKILGEAFLQEQWKEQPDLNSVRYAQGELYFHLKDYETAIFKWGKVDNQLQVWAQKNIADAHYASGQLKEAKRLYKMIKIEDSTIGTEVALKLFSIYRELVELNQAAEVIKEIVAINPDYPNVTTIARTFFEEYTDWSNAIELAASEVVRTQSIEWFAVLQKYIDKGITKSVSPEYFSQVVTSLFYVDRTKFKQFVCSLWRSYQHEELHFSWVTSFNALFFDLNVSQSDNWDELLPFYEDTYRDWMSGYYLIAELADVMPPLLTNWLKISPSPDAGLAAAAVLSWNDAFPGRMSSIVVNESESLLHRSKDADGFDHSVGLCKSIIDWTKEKEVALDNRVEWLLSELESKEGRLVVAGLSGEAKASLIQAVLGERIVGAAATSVVVFKDSDGQEIKEVAEREGLRNVGFAEFQQLSEAHRQTHFIEYSLPCPFLRKHCLALIDTPIYKEKEAKAEEWLSYFHLADRVLFVLDSDTMITDKERKLALEMKERMPHVPIDFVLIFRGSTYQEQETRRLTELTKSTLNRDFPEAAVFSCHPNFHRLEDESSLDACINVMKDKRHQRKIRTANLLYYIRETITHLLKKRVEREQYLAESIRWNEEILQKLNGAKNQVSDLEKSQIENIKRSYETVIKEEIVKEITNTIPILLKDCTHLLKEETDYRTIHHELNKEMNMRIENYILHTIVPQFRQSLFQWIHDSKAAFDEIQVSLDKMGEMFNAMYKEERFTFAGDFQILEDWRRDADRMTNMVSVEPVNIFLQHKPSQLLLVSSGKLLSSFNANKAMMVKMYKKFVENEDYHKVAEEAAAQFMKQFAFFEKTLERDIQMFFRNPLNDFRQALEQMHEQMRENKFAYNDFQITPQIYMDPLTLFKVRLEQMERAWHRPKYVENSVRE